MRRQKPTKRGAEGRRWTRKDRPVLELGQRDESGLLEILTPDAGTKGGHRYCSAQCLCGCNAVVEIRIDNFLAGKASCPTRRKAANRKAMEQKQHIKMMQLINAIISGKNRPESVRDAAVRYARHVTADTQLQAQIRQRNSKSLADRDIKRCAELAAKQGVKPVTQPAPVAAAPVAPTGNPVSAKKPGRTPEEIARLEKHDILVRVSGGPLEWSVKGEAWKQAGEPPLDKFVYTKPASSREDPLPVNESKKPEPAKNPLLRDVPFYQTEAGFDATQAYFNEFRKMPADDFDLEAYWTNRQRKRA